MKICKNDTNITLHPVIGCSMCAIRTRTSPCLWLRIVGTKSTWGCGGIGSYFLSDIFKL